jgi:hypothetical protein
MGGYGMAIVGGVIQGTGVLIAVGGSIKLLANVMDGSFRRVQIQVIRALDVKSLTSRWVTRGEAGDFTPHEDLIDISPNEEEAEESTASVTPVQEHG